MSRVELTGIGTKSGFPLSVCAEGSRIFEFLGAKEIISSSMLTCRDWNQLQSYPTLWESCCMDSRPDIASAIARYEPHGGRGWYSACCALLRAGLLCKSDDHADDCRVGKVCGQGKLVCPGCEMDMVGDLLKLFAALDVDSKGSINMLEKAVVVEDVYQHDDRSALRPDLFRHIVQESCNEYLRKRGKKTDGSASIDVSEFLEYFRHLLFGEEFNGEHCVVVRRLRPWSTAATHNLVRLLGDPTARCECTVPPPPELVEMWRDREADNDEMWQALLDQPP